MVAKGGLLARLHPPQCCQQSPPRARPEKGKKATMNQMWFTISLLQNLDSRRVLVGTPGTFGAGSKNTSQIQILRHLQKKRRAVMI